MSPPKPPRGAGAIGGLNAHAAMGAFAMLHPDEDEDEDAERADALIGGDRGVDGPGNLGARVEKAKRESAVLARRLQHWPAHEMDASSDRRSQRRERRRAPRRSPGVARAAQTLERAGDAPRENRASGARFVQTVRRRVRGVFVTGLCAVTAPAPPRRASLSSNDTALGPRRCARVRPRTTWCSWASRAASCAPRADGVAARLQPRRLPRRLPRAARAFRRAPRRTRGDSGAPGKGKGPPREWCFSRFLGDMPQEVLLRVLALAAVPISDWIDESAAGSI